MKNQLDEKNFSDFISKVKEKKLLSLNMITELEGFKDKSNVSPEDWDLLVDKECYPNKDGKNNE